MRAGPNNPLHLTRRAVAVARGVQALEVGRLSELFRGLGLGIRVSPEYRWPLG